MWAFRHRICSQCAHWRSCPYRRDLPLCNKFMFSLCRTTHGYLTISNVWGGIHSSCCHGKWRNLGIAAVESKIYCSRKPGALTIIKHIFQKQHLICHHYKSWITNLLFYCTLFLPPYHPPFSSLAMPIHPLHFNNKSQNLEALSILHFPYNDTVS